MAAARRRTSTALRVLRTLLATSVLAGASLTGAAHAAPPVAPSRGFNDFTCRPSAAHPRPVVLVHGTFANSIANWPVLGPDLVRHGYCVFALDYGQIGLPLVHGLGPIEESARQLEDYVDRVRVATGAREVDIVGHSQGGLMPRYYLRHLGGADEVREFIGIAPPNHGTTRNGEVNLVRATGLDGVQAHLFPAVPQQYAGSAFLTGLNHGRETVPGVHYTVIATRYDQAVTPYWSSFLDGPNVRNLLVQDLCPTDLAIHETLGITDRIAHHEIRNILDPAHATPTTCASALT
ncbi:lipase [Streptomyces ruber]|uniref:Lipase n=2 Tax=Streptomyces TaxID=1883 RepID=A0A918EXQ4_9ACTN|nr:alpha/beta fold hydrolase [Streptomyces ruber]GGQ87972.1 lipase [Streptomyces ruber]